MQKPAGASAGVSPAEKLFFPPGAKPSAVSKPADPPFSPTDDRQREKRSLSDRDPPGVRSQPKPAEQPDPLETIELPPSVELPPGVESPPLAQPSLAANLLGATQAAIPHEIDDLLPQAAEPAPPSANEKSDGLVVSPAVPTKETLERDRRRAEHRDHRRFLGNLIVWGVCTLLLCLAVWILLFAAR